MAGIHIPDHSLKQESITLFHRRSRQVSSVGCLHVIPDPVPAGSRVVLKGIMNPLRDIRYIILHPMRPCHRKDRPDLTVLPDGFQRLSVQINYILPAAGHRYGHSNLRQNRNALSVNPLAIQSKTRFLGRCHGKFRSHGRLGKHGEGILFCNMAEGSVRAGHISHNAIPDTCSGEIIAALHTVKQHIVYIEINTIAGFVIDQRQPALIIREGNTPVALGIPAVIISHNTVGRCPRRKKLH